MAGKNLYEDKSAIPKPSSFWVIEPHPSEKPYPKPEPITPPEKPRPPYVYERPKREGTINKHAIDQLEKSRKYGQ